MLELFKKYASESFTSICISIWRCLSLYAPHKLLWHIVITNKLLSIASPSICFHYSCKYSPVEPQSPISLLLVIAKFCFLHAYLRGRSPCGPSKGCLQQTDLTVNVVSISLLLAEDDLMKIEYEFHVFYQCYYLLGDIRSVVVFMVFQVYTKTFGCSCGQMGQSRA